MTFAGHLLVYLVRAHCFVDGNKRVAWTATMRVLAAMGLTITASTDDAERFVTDLLAPASTMTGDDVILWLAARLTSAY